MAPGRVNVIGEHADYNDGYVLPFAVERAVYAAAGPRRDCQVVVTSRQRGQLESAFVAVDPFLVGDEITGQRPIKEAPQSDSCARKQPPVSGLASGGSTPKAR
jgi:hypothetical protein